MIDDINIENVEVVTTHPGQSPNDEVAELRAEVAELRGRLDRAAAASVTGEAAKLRNEMKPVTE